MKHSYTPLLALTAITSVTSCHVSKEKKATPPNLVFIMADQWRGDAIGYLGIEPVQTPSLDELASEGVHFINAISSYPVSSPARGMLMTGQYPVKNGVTGNCNSNNTPYHVEMRTEARCWSDVLKEKGYELGYIGKWHLDAPYTPYVETSNNKGAVAWNEWCPKERRHGFDHWIAYGTYDQHLKPMYWDTDAGRDEFYFVDQWGPEYEADRAIEYIANTNGKLRDPKQPFGLVVSMNPPHTGYHLVPDRYKDIYKDIDVESLCNQPHIPPKGTPNGDFFRKSILDYYACISGVDEQVGRIVAELKRQGLFENTIIVFTSDHGDSMGMHENIGKNIYYEEAMRIPMIITWPQQLKTRQEKELPIAFADLYPTMLSLMGYEKDIPEEVQTFNLAEEVINGASEELIQPYYLVSPSNVLTGYRGLRSNRYTFVVHATDGVIDETLLFDRITDPRQMENIADKEPEIAKKFSLQLKEWLISTDDLFAACIKE